MRAREFKRINERHAELVEASLLVGNFNAIATKRERCFDKLSMTNT